MCPERRSINPRGNEGRGMNRQKGAGWNRMENITLEMSLKPFKKTDSAFIEQVCEQIFEQWKPLVKLVPCVRVLLWSADGSELLDYRGRLDDSFEWAYFIGGAEQREGDNSRIDPEGTGLHTRNYLYQDSPPVMTYRILREIVATLKKAARKVLGDRDIRVGTTVDPGPEFARSDFKYKRHNEICLGTEMGKSSNICAYALLDGDDVAYAAYPDGIPDKTPFGTFLGKQAQIFLKDMGFDYIWFSNGLGFGRDVWATVGAVFDGKHFHYEKMEDVKKAVLDFWHFFRKECPDYPIETRGTNMTMGIDFATDGVPLRQIYGRKFNLLPPPNSPWAALNGDYGLELAGYLSRIAQLPGEEYLFRYYIHDPWWANSPWYDRYNSQPHDIYLPLGVARLDGEGNVKAPTHMNLLTIDNSYGDCPDSCANEVIPHLNKALKELPDAAAPVVWIYPFDEYSACSSEQEAREMFFGDWFIRGAINNGFPISMVVSTDNFIEQNKEIYQSSVLVSPIPVKDSEYETQILHHAHQGGRVIFYGDTSRAGGRFLAFLGIRNGDEISGELPVDVFGKSCGILKHQPVVCGGGIGTEACAETDVLARAGTKAIAVRAQNAIWVRGTVSADFVPGSQLLVSHDSKRYFIGETLMRKSLALLGYEIEFESEAGIKTPVFVIHRHNNAYFFSCYSPSTTVKTRLKFPFGAPVLDGYETRLENGCATYVFPKSEHRECRVFVEQEGGIVGCREVAPVSYWYRRRIEIRGLQNAVVRVLAETYCQNNIHVVLNSQEDWFNVGDAFEGGYVTIDGAVFYEARNVTGTLVFSMPTGK